MDRPTNPRIEDLDAGTPAGARVSPRLHMRGPERALSVAAGGLLAGWAIRRGGVLGCLAGLAGSVLIARGATGMAPVRRALTPSQLEKDEARRRGWSTAAAVSWAVTINRPRQELYDYWRNFANLSDVLENVEKVDVIDDTHSEWSVRGPAGVTIKWKAMVTEDLPGQRIAWSSEDKAMVKNTGWIEFRDAGEDRGTEVHALILYEPPAGQTGRMLAKLLRREPGIQLRRDLRRFKQLMEAGEISANLPQSIING
ncbi:MAG TPA: SRPBCC family protein [Pedomonas sp.]|uniref:SRPBCC family protein n=1 Tax=Pedomonas sp. TaxID=2976421 RepID=UPI002F4226C0